MSNITVSLPMEVQGLVTVSAKVAFSWPSVDRFGTFFGGLKLLKCTKFLLIRSTDS